MKPNGIEGPAKTGDLIRTNGYACELEGCVRRYETTEGYFDVIHGSKVHLENQNRKPCPDEPELALYLESFKGGVRTWRCPDSEKTFPD